MRCASGVDVPQLNVGQFSPSLFLPNSLLNKTMEQNVNSKSVCFNFLILTIIEIQIY